jgi:hypothetical protein
VSLLASDPCQLQITEDSGPSTGTKYRLLRGARQLHFDELLGREQVILAGVVDDANQSLIARASFGRQRLVHLAYVQINFRVLARLNTHDEPRSTSVHSRCSRLFTLNRLLPIPCASYQCSSASHTLPSAYRTSAIPFIFRQWSRPNLRHRYLRVRTAEPVAIVSISRINPTTSKSIGSCALYSRSYLGL